MALVCLARLEGYKGSLKIAPAKKGASTRTEAKSKATAKR
jgi:hypothetical protein